MAVDPATGKDIRVDEHQKLGEWTLMAVVQTPQGDLAVFENVGNRAGSILYVGRSGVVVTLPESLAATSVADGTLFRGKTVEEIAQSRTDVLAESLLAGSGDPNYNDVAAALPPLRVPTFVGTRQSIEKPTWDYGGFSDEIYVDAGKVFPEIQAARNKHDVYEGLIGGWLPVMRFVFPSGANRYWEESMFASETGTTLFIQPVWYRVLLVENGELKEAHYFYHHLPFPPRGEPKGWEFYSELLKVYDTWKHDLNPGMKVDVPDKRILDFCLHDFAVEMITRVGSHPKYGYPPLGGINVFGGYGYSNVDTFQDTFNASVRAALDWGLYDLAAGYIDDYFTNSVRDDGSIDTRGPEIGQYGVMLTVMAKYYDYTHDDRLMRKFQGKLEAIVKLFYSLRAEAKTVDPSDPSYGIVRGWSEHDSSLKVNPYRFMLPHFSNNAEAARGFHDLGEAWLSMAKRIGDASLQKEAEGILTESEAMKKDLYAGIEKSIDHAQNPPYMPAVAHDTPTWGKGRVYSELMDSGELTQDMVKVILDYQGAHGGLVMELPRGGTHITGFLDFGPAYARIQNDWVRQFLLYYYAHMAHIYSPGTWTSVESAKMDGTLGGPYAVPSQLTIPVLTKWMLAFEDPDEPVLWLARATPRAWLEQGEKIAVTAAPTRFGKVSYEIQSAISQGQINATIDLPEGYDATTKLRLRAPDEKRMTAVTVNGEKWTNFDAAEEVITLPPSMKGRVSVKVSY